MGVLLSLEEAFSQLREEIEKEAKSVKSLADAIKKDDSELSPSQDKGEIIANLILSYRHLEDARMRVGKAIQAYNGGESIYDKKQS